jgi:hypothetical protein
MKKILNEWRKYITETEAKHPRKLNPRNPYDRAATDYTRQKTLSGNDPRSELRYYLSNATYHAADPRAHMVTLDQTVEFVMNSDSKPQLISDLKLIHYLMDPKHPTKYVARSNAGSLIFNDTGPLATDSPAIILGLLRRIGESEIQIKPSDSELEKVFKYYIAPTNKSLWPVEDAPPEPPTDRFSHLLNIPPEMRARMDQMEREREDRIRAARRRRRSRKK